MSSPRLNTKKCVILIQDIYGINKQMHYYEELFCKMGFDVVIPYVIDAGRVFDYEEEQNASAHFMENIGFEKSKKDLESVIQDLSTMYGEIHLVGFSVGATTAWLCSENKKVKSVLGFYGAHITEYTNINPISDVWLIFANEETAFNPFKLQIILNQKPNVTTEVIDGNHGFADPFHSHYNELATKEILEKWKKKHPVFR